MLSLHGAANFTLAGMGIWALCEGKSRERRWSARALAPLWPLLAGWAMSLPLLLSIHPNHGPGGFTWPSLDGALRDLCEVVFANPRLWTRFLHLPWQVVWAAQLAALGGAAYLGWRALSTPEGSPARRFIFSLLAGIPLGAMIAQFFHSSAMGPARYMAAFSVPASLCLAVAWGAPVVAWGAPMIRRRERMYLKMYRGLLIFVLAVQAAGAALDRGDRHREGVHWILAQRRTDEPVIVSTSGMNLVAFEYLAGGTGGKSGNITGIHGRIRDSEQVKDALRKAFANNARRGFLFLYHTRSPILETLDDLRREGWAADYKTWKIGSEVEVVALILDPSERQWLDSLPPPRKLWGPDSSRE